MLDLITIGETMAAFTPGCPGRLCYQLDYRLHMAGAESNTAIGLRKLGHTAGWISRLGGDELGHYVLNSIRAEGVDISRVTIAPERRTGLMIKELSAGETHVYYYRDHSAFSFFEPGHLDEEYLLSAKILHLTGITPVLGESCLNTVQAAADFAVKNGLKLSFDPNIRKKLWDNRDYTPEIRKLVFSADIVLMGLDEANQLLGTSDVPEIVRQIISEKGRASIIAIKNGAQGAWAADKNGIYAVEPYPCKSVDPIGAGDAFNAAFLAGVLEGKSTHECGMMGAVAGALATQTSGDIEGQPLREELDAALNRVQTIYR